jgi:hypothetical protein
VSRLVLALLPFAFVSAGCSHGTKQVEASVCDRARAEALRGPDRNALQGDVTGDGVPDRVSIVRLSQRRTHCGAFLLVRSRGRTLARPLAATPLPGVPRLTGLAALGPGRGLQVVVTPWEGASTVFARVYVVRSGRILALSNGVSDSTAETGDTFPYEGGVTHYNALDCVHGRPGMIVASGWFEGRSGSFGFERHFYRVGADRLELVRSRSGKTRLAFPDTKVFREFRAPQPFPSCMRVRAE